MFCGLETKGIFLYSVAGWSDHLPGLFFIMFQTDILHVTLRFLVFSSGVYAGVLLLFAYNDRTANSFI